MKTEAEIYKACIDAELIELATYLISHQTDMPPEFIKIVSDNFWDLLA